MRDDVKIFNTLQAFHQLAADKGYYPYATMLKGSQNYNLDDAESDIDANLIFIPTPSQIRKNDTFKLTLPEGECTCHNIYSFAEIVAKGNPQWIEVCHTPYHIGHSIALFKHYVINPSALKGMFMEKVNAFDKLYPSRAHMVEKHGYDPKQLHHLIRLYDLLVSGQPILEYQEPERSEMLAIKRGLLTKPEAQQLMTAYIAKLQDIYESKKLAYYPQPIDYSAIDQLVLQFYKEL